MCIPVHVACACACACTCVPPPHRRLQPAKCAGKAPLTLHPSRPSLCSSWEKKCKWQLNCAGCPECDAVTPPPPNCKPWCANNGKCVQPFSVSHTLSYAPTHLACVPPTHRPNAQAFLTPTPPGPCAVRGRRSANGSSTVRAAQSATSAGICSFDVDVHYYVYYVY